METRITVTTRQLLLTLIVALALLAAYLIGSHGGPPATAAAATTPQRSITLTGTGTAQAVPDELGFTVAVGHTATDTETALTSTNGTMRAVLARLAKLGVARRDTESTDLSVQPTYRYVGGREEISGYHASQSVQVTVRDLTKVSKVLGAAVDTGGNDPTVEGVQLQVHDPERAEAAARRNAVADARAKATAYAAATGQHLGEVRSISERAVAPVQPLSLGPRRSPAAAAQQDVVPVRKGRQPVSATITVVWTLR